MKFVIFIPAMRNYKGSYILGLDLSLNGTGVVLIDGSDLSVLIKTCIKLNSNTKNQIKGIERVSLILEEILKVIAMIPIGRLVIAIEGYSYGSRGQALFDLGELGGCIRLALHQKGIEYLVIPPKTLKKFIAGSGNADKKEMMAAVTKKYSHTFENDNINDAFALAVFVGQDGFNSPLIETKKTKSNKEKPSLGTLSPISGNNFKLLTTPSAKKYK